jgi:hypothetical protein
MIEFLLRSNAMNPVLAPLAEILKLNTRLFNNALDGVDEKTMAIRIDGRLSSIGFIAIHMLDARFFLAKIVGAEAVHPFKEMFDAIESIDDIETYPDPAEIRKAWDDVSSALLERIESLKEADLAQAAPIDFPVDDKTALGGIAFLLKHESYHLGQLGLLRRFCFLDPMKYD